MNALVVGCGYLGHCVVRKAPADWNWYALTRSAHRGEELRAAGIRPLVGNWLNRAELGGPWPDFDALLIAVPHRPDPELGDATHVVGLGHVLDNLPSLPQRIVYISTTGVYANSGGTFDEQTEPAPQRPGGRIALAAERWLQDHLPATGLILRSAGIYGPGRLPMLDRMRRNEPLPVAPQAMLNLIHVEDLARAAVELLRERPPHSLYVAADGHPVARGEFYRYMAQRLGLAEPRFEPPAGGGRRGTGGKRVCPSRLLRDLDFQFLYPSYRSGIDALCDQL
ncbi:MAG: SDR family NAD(P)-dependent oxidoreductase [Planctomycetota bacterium]|nr:MAG: SDR family NAD(P)-dependent oxidoreductase [Planctomycetota bacterium]